MKKILYILGFMMFISVALQPIVTFGQEQFSGEEEDIPFSTARIFSKLVESIDGLNPDADWADTFGEDDEKDVGKNLYLTIYNKIENQPIKDTNEDMAGKYGMTKADMVRILHTDYSPIVAKKPGLTQGELQAKLMEIQQAYKEKKELYDLKANIKASVEMSEIFANGDLSDSGFDLINDLNIIEEILFLHTSELPIGGPYASGGEGGGPSTNSGSTGKTSSATTGDKSGINKNPTVPGTVSYTKSALTESPDKSDSGFPDDEFNPNKCFSDNDLENSLNDFEDKAKTDDSYKDGSAGAGSPAAANRGHDSTYSGTNPTGKPPEKDDDFFPAKPDSSEEEIPPANPFEWLSSKLPCNQVYCLTLNVVEEPATTSFSDTSNCIACHTEHINDVLKDVVSHSLVPSKAPGNLGESAQCKKGVLNLFDSASMNFYAIAMPVSTPVNDDIIYGPTIEEDLENFCSETAFSFLAPACDALESKKTESENTQEYEVPESLIDRATKQAITQTPDEVNQEELFNRIDDIVTGYQKEQEEREENYLSGLEADESSQMYQTLSYELNQMNYYFSNIHDILHSLHEAIPEIPGKQACTKINNIEECP